MPADKEYVRFADSQVQGRNFSHMFASQTRFPSVEISLEIYGMGYRTLLPSWNYPLHEHQSFEINYVTEGEQMFTINGVEYAQRTGEVILVRPGDVHCSRAGEDEQGRKQGFSCFLLHFFLED
jgi:mannose-6-phosphate isomerase-like protein (cupin superfamily)